MQITTFNPMILSKDAEAVIALFEELGFEKKHAPTVDTGKSMVTSTRMKDSNGFHIDIADVKSVPQDMTIIRMNVDDYDEAAEMLRSNGFRESKIVPSNYTASSKYAFFISPSGFIIDLIKHIKNEDR